MESTSFLGRGWSFPVEFTKGGAGVEMSSNEGNIDQSIDILLTTEVTERLMHPDFGCELQQFIYEKLNAGLISRIKDTITNAILMHEPRVDLLNIEVNRDKDNFELLLINMEYKVRSTNARSNKVYPFYLREASNL